MGVKRVPVAVEDVVKKSPLDTAVGVKAIFDQKRALGDLVYKEAKALDPGGRVEQLRAIYGRLSSVEVHAIDAAATEAGDGAGALLKARKNYQALSIAKNALDETSSRMATNRNVSLSGYLAAGMAASGGHLLAAPIVAIAHETARRRGNAFLASTLDKLGAFQTVAKKGAEVESQINKGVRAFASRARGELKSLPAAKVTGEKLREEFDRRAADVTDSVGENHGDVVQTLAKHAPGVSANFTDSATRATTWLAEQMPKPAPIGSKTVSDQDAKRWLLQARAIDDPVGTITRGMANGNLSPVEVDAIRQCGAYTELDKYIQQRFAEEAAKTFKGQLAGQAPYPLRRDLALLFDMPEWSMSPEGIKTLQANTQAPPGGAGGKPGASGVNSPKRPMPDRSATNQPETDRLPVGQIREK
jgi:hypothetical protein